MTVDTHGPTPASSILPKQAITQAIAAPNMPVAWPKLRDSEKMPPPIEPTTIPVGVRNGSFWAALTVSSMLSIPSRDDSASKSARPDSIENPVAIA